MRKCDDCLPATARVLCSTRSIISGTPTGHATRKAHETASSRLCSSEPHSTVWSERMYERVAEGPPGPSAIPKASHDHVSKTPRETEGSTQYATKMANVRPCRSGTTTASYRSQRDLRASVSSSSPSA